MKSLKQPPRFPTRTINVKDVRIGDRLRQPSTEGIIDLAASIQSLGQLHPIWVRDLVEGGYLLISGNRRLCASIHLSMTKISAVVVPVGAMLDEQIEVQENLAREGLSALEEAEHHVKWKSYYDRTNTSAADSASEDAGDERNDFVVPPAYTVQAAKKLSNSVRSIQHALQIGGMVEDVRDLLRGTKLADRKVDLLKLSKLSVEEQRRIAQVVVERKFKNLSDAWAYLAAQVTQPDALTPPDEEVEKLKKVLALIAKLNFKAIAKSDECRSVINRSLPKTHELSTTLVLLLEELNPANIVTIIPQNAVGKAESYSTIVESEAEADMTDSDESESLLDLATEDFAVGDQGTAVKESRGSKQAAKSKQEDPHNLDLFEDEDGEIRSWSKYQAANPQIERHGREEDQSRNERKTRTKQEEEEGDDVF